MSAGGSPFTSDLLDSAIIIPRVDRPTDRLTLPTRPSAFSVFLFSGRVCWLDSVGRRPENAKDRLLAQKAVRNRSADRSRGRQVVPAPESGSSFIIRAAKQPEQKQRAAEQHHCSSHPTTELCPPIVILGLSILFTSSSLPTAPPSFLSLFIYPFPLFPTCTLSAHPLVQSGPGSGPSYHSAFLGALLAPVRSFLSCPGVTRRHLSVLPDHGVGGATAQRSQAGESL